MDKKNNFLKQIQFACVKLVDVKTGSEFNWHLLTNRYKYLLNVT